MIALDCTVNKSRRVKVKQKSIKIYGRYMLGYESFLEGHSVHDMVVYRIDHVPQMKEEKNVRFEI